MIPHREGRPNSLQENLDRFSFHSFNFRTVSLVCLGHRFRSLGWENFTSLWPETFLSYNLFFYENFDFLWWSIPSYTTTDGTTTQRRAVRALHRYLKGHVQTCSTLVSLGFLLLSCFATVHIQLKFTLFHSRIELNCQDYKWCSEYNTELN